MMQSSPSTTMYTTAHQQLACLMELRQFQQQQQSNYNNRPEISISPSYNYNNSSSSNQSQINNRPPSKAFTIDAILGLHNNNNEQCRLKSKSSSVSSQNTAGIVASFAAACRRNAVAVLGSTTLQDPSKSDPSISGKHHKQSGVGVGSGAGKSKRVRTIFTPEQLERLEAEFERQQYMVGPERLYLASALHLTEAQVKVWFQNRRIKWRKQHLEIQQQRLAALKQQQQQHLQMGHEEESMSDASSNSDNPD